MTSTPPNEAVGAYKDPNKGSSILPWILGLLALLALLLLLLWALGVFGGDDDVDNTTLDRDDNAVIVDDADDRTFDDDDAIDIEDDRGEADMEEGFTPPPAE